ncbi:hypothetical protein [Proteocatella sphenisci]|uniref:hypothetical protein n=1 Tax=Proteocatella sphenisci TaxID=181070 RepID=UPI00048B1F1E|nr:hypothetical protein [Proteocatella sphenisci]
MEGIILIVISYIFSRISKQKKTSSHEQSPFINMKLNKNMKSKQVQDNTLPLKAEEQNYQSKANDFHSKKKELDFETKPDISKKTRISFENEPGFELESKTDKGTVNLFKNKDSIRRAVIMSEILGKPKSINK